MSFLAMSTPPVLSNVAGNCSAYKPDCIGDAQKVLFYTALALIAIGISGHITSLKSFLKQQLENPTPWQVAGGFAAKMETRRLDVTRRHCLPDKPNGKIPTSMFLLLPQYLLLAALDGISNFSIDYFFTDQVPASMKPYS
nr:protein nrt1/ ptr family 5.15 [Quercus suber]